MKEARTRRRAVMKEARRKKRKARRRNPERKRETSRAERPLSMPRRSAWLKADAPDHVLAGSDVETDGQTSRGDHGVLPTLLQASGPASSPSALRPAVGNRRHPRSRIGDLRGHAACTGCVAESFIEKCTGPATAWLPTCFTLGGAKTMGEARGMPRLLTAYRAHKISTAKGGQKMCNKSPSPPRSKQESQQE